MEKQDIANAILSKDATKLGEAKQALKDLLTARNAKLREDMTKFAARAMFEGK